jgi:hypothetical protein
MCWLASASSKLVVVCALARVATAIHAREQIVDDRFLTAVLPSEQTVDMHVDEALAQLRDGYCELVSVREITQLTSEMHECRLHKTQCRERRI